MITQISIEPYPKKLFLVIDEPDAEVMMWFHKENDDYRGIYKLPEEDEARTIRTPKGNTVVRFSKFPECHGSIAHEAFHAAYSILDYVGMRLTDDSEEGFAYMVDYITRKIYDAKRDISVQD